MSSCCPGSRLKGADIALAGNPNVGKSMLINQLTSIGAVVSNYPGTTVEILEGEGKFKGKTFRVADLPGTYSLKGVSEDEKVAIKYLNSAKPKVIINVVDATKLERNLFLTLQLLKLETPTIIALNFHDEAEKKGMFINNSKLSALLGVPVIPINALTGIGISALLEQSFASLKNKRVSRTFRRSRHRFAGHLDVRKFHEFKPQRFERINTKQIVSTTSMSLIEAKAAAENIFDETMTPVQIAALLTSLKMRGESIDEICAFAQVLREKSIRIAPRVDALVDTCGTGGDSSNTFNISTAAAIIASSAGAAVAKHGNRSVSSKSGSADVFEKLGAKLLQPQEVKQCIEKTSFGFMFAPYFNPIMKQVAGVRKELGFRTIFNIVGPLTNPASANFQLLGVFDPGMVEKTAECLLKLDSKHAMVVHSEGLDEIGLGTTNIAEVKNGIVESYEIDASDFGFRKKEIPLVQTSEESAKIINRVLVGAEDSAARDICLLNASAALYISGKATGLEECISKAANAIDSGKAKAKLEDIIEFGARN